MLRNGVKHGPHRRRPVLRHAVAGQRQGGASGSRRTASRVTRQLRYSRDETQSRSTWPVHQRPAVATFELKNSLTKQTVEDAVEQYKRDRDPREQLFEFGRCVVHFAVDDSEVRFCTAPEGQGLVVPAVQQGLERRRGQPAQPGRPQDRLPLEARSSRRAGLTDILENYAQIVETKDAKTGKKKRDADLPALPPARRGAQAAGRRRRSTARASAT